MPERNDIWMRSLRVAGWALLASGTLMLLIAAMNIGSTRRCDGVRIAYAPGGNGAYVPPNDVYHWMGGTSPAFFQGRPVKEIDLLALERGLEKQPWVRDADLYIDRNRVLHVYVSEREPVARIFTTEGLSFYLDSTLGRIPISGSHTPRVLVFTGLPVNGKSWSRRDSLLVREVRDMAVLLASDSLLNALVEQVDMDPVKGFTLVPKVGEHIIVLGDLNGLEDKFRRMKIFYQQVLSRTGWSTYSELDLRFEGQVVALPVGGLSMTSGKAAPSDSTLAADQPDKYATDGLTSSVQPLKDVGKAQMKRPAGHKPVAAGGKPKAVMPAQQ